MAGVLACGEARRPNEKGKLVPPWLKIVVVLEELGETHTAGSEDHRVDATALRAVGHGHGGAHRRKNYGSLVTAPRTALWRLREHCGARAASPTDDPVAQDGTTMTAPSTRRGTIRWC